MSSKRAPATYTGLLGFLGRLRRDARGNALAFMAAMMIPLAGLAGSAVDMGRLYAVKSRLQQACDAGVLAGRKFMTDPTAATLDSTAAGQANTVFSNNFRAGWFSTNTVSFLPSKTSESEVSATASATVPMVLMQLFGQTSKTISVTCAARYDVADADIMFVLDTTGSMACAPSDSDSNCDSYDGGNTHSDYLGYYVTEKSGSRISVVRTSVLTFVDKVTSLADQTTNFRFGFVPFSVAVNVGRLLQPMGYMASAWSYQSREVNADDVFSTSNPTPVTAANQQACTGSSSQSTVTTRSPATALTYNTDGTATNTILKWASNSCTKTVQTLIPKWLYKREDNFPISQFLASTASNPIDNPAQVDLSSTYWNGCVEERYTTPGTTSFDPAHPPLDLDVDTAPSGASNLGPTDPRNTYWGPLWPDVQFARLSTNETTSASRDITQRPVNASTMSPANSYYAYLLEQIACPLQANRLSQIQVQGSASASTHSSAITAAKSAIQSYMLAANGYRPFGKTYLDTGMTWGTRLLSPNGIFKNDTAAWPGHNDPNRYLIFLTDGNMEPDCYANASHGMEQYDQRVMSSGCSASSLETYHNARFAAACTIAKNHGMSVFVILFGQSVTALPAQFTTCATAGQAYYATDQAGLDAAFSKIAQQVAMLRLSK